MRRRVVLVQLVMIAALGAPAACAQIEGLSGLHYDGGNTNAGGASGSGGASSGTPSSSGPGGSGAGANGGSGAGANGGGSSVGGAGGAPPLCGNGATCVDVPNGWKGPIILFPNGSASMMCPASYPNTAFDGGTMPSDAPVTCIGCACDQAPCGSFQLLVFQQPTCSDEHHRRQHPRQRRMRDVQPDQRAQRVDGSHARLGPMQRQRRRRGESPGHALPRSRVRLRPRERRGDVWRRRRLRAQGQHDAELRLPVGRRAACPASFPNSTSIFTSITDGRGCTSCSCGSPIGSCNGEVRLFTTTNCTGPNRKCRPTDSATRAPVPARRSRPPCHLATATGGAPNGLDERERCRSPSAASSAARRGESGCSTLGHGA